MSAVANQKQVLIVDRDIAQVEALRQRLCDMGFAVRSMADAAGAVTLSRERTPHLVILDRDRPDSEVLEVIVALRAVRVPHNIRLILMSRRASESDVVAGLNLGADDYIVKPFSLREAAARVSAVLRSCRSEQLPPLITCNGLTLDASTSRVTAQGRPLQLRGSEYRLLEFLMRHPGRTFDRAQLLEQVWAGGGVDERTIDVNVQRLRKILAEPGYEAYIQTVRGFGYRFGASP